MAETLIKCASINFLVMYPSDSHDFISVQLPTP